jgi:hypothetical protein
MLIEDRLTGASVDAIHCEERRHAIVLCPHCRNWNTRYCAQCHQDTRLAQHIVAADWGTACGRGLDYQLYDSALRILKRSDPGHTRVAARQVTEMERRKVVTVALQRSPDSCDEVAHANPPSTDSSEPVV